MICSLKGKIENAVGNYIELDVCGVGYLVYVGNGFMKRHQVGEETKVRTYMAVSENDMALYGFETTDELNLFKMLITVSGVGPKTGASILADCRADEIMKAIGDANVEFFQEIKGIGKKTAQRIIVDLKSKIGGLGELDLNNDGRIDDKDELFLSLKQLGFDKKEIEGVVKKMPNGMVSIEDRLGWCLKNIN